MEKPKIAIVTMIKNECDIIELFIRHNAPFCRKFYVNDHQSTDNTLKILEQLIKEGFDIDIAPIEHMGYVQSHIMTKAVREASLTGEFDYIIPLDADEFLPWDKKLSFVKMLYKKVGPRQSGSYCWKNFVPLSSNYNKFANPLIENFSGVDSFHSDKSRKILVGNKYGKRCELTMGNHGASCEKYGNSPKKLDAELQHFPIRSCEQALRKSFLNTYSFKFAKNQWGEIDDYNKGNFQLLYPYIQENNGKFDYEMLLAKAFGLTLEEKEKIADFKVNREELPKLDPDIKIKYKNLAKIDVLNDVHKFTMNLIDSVNGLQTGMKRLGFF